MKRLFILVSLSTSLVASAQKNFQPGYIIKNDGQRVEGFINYREWNHNPRQIGFTTDKNANDEQNFTVKDIRYFEITGKESYERFPARISMDEGSNVSLALERDTSYKTDTVFMKLHARGQHINLYSYTDGLKTRFYILRANGSEIVELIYKRYAHLGELIDESTFRIQLEEIANSVNMNQAKLMNKIRVAAYTKPRLTKIVNEINGVSSVPDASAKANRPPLFRGFAGAGVVRTKISVDGVHLMNGAQNDNTSLSPRVSGGVDLFIFRNTGKLFLRSELGYQTAKAVLESSNPAVDDATVQIKTRTLFLTEQLIFNFYNTRNLKIFAGGGLSFYKSTFPENDFRLFSSLGPNATVQKDYFGFKDDVYISHLWRAGATVNRKLEFSLLYQGWTTMTNAWHMEWEAPSWDCR